MFSASINHEFGSAVLLKFTVLLQIFDQEKQMRSRGFKFSSGKEISISILDQHVATPIPGKELTSTSMAKSNDTKFVTEKFISGINT